jgi:hypothetical protein
VQVFDYMDLASGGRKLSRNVDVYEYTRRRTPEYLGVCMNASYDSLRSRMSVLMFKINPITGLDRP